MKTKCIPITLITYTLTENWHKEKLKVIENTNPHAIPDLIFRLALVIFHQYAIQKLWTTLRLALQKIQQKMDNVKLINALKFRDLKVLIKSNRLEVVKEKVNLLISLFMCFSCCWISTTNSVIERKGIFTW